jgi:clan AA aspartic protease
MITGTVNADYEAIVRLRIQSPSGHEYEVDAILDTGFNGFLTLPSALIGELGLIRLGRGRALLADDREELLNIYGVTVLWDGQPKHVEVDAVNCTPLLGMSLLKGHDLRIAVVDGGTVIIGVLGQ